MAAPCSAVAAATAPTSDGGDERPGRVMDEDDAGVVRTRHVERGEPGLDRLLSARPAGHDVDDRAGSQAASAIAARRSAAVTTTSRATSGRGDQGVEGPGQERPPADLDRELVAAAHPASSDPRRRR